MSRSAVSLIERGRLDELRFGTALRVAAALEVRLEVRARWRGGDLDRLLNAGHSALHESLARYLQALSGWVFAPEVSFAIYGERGIIDILAWHPGRRALLVIELKTDIADVQELIGTVDRKRRLAARIARERGWDPLAVSAWVIVADTKTNWRRVQRHAAVLRAAFPRDGRTLRSWLRDPAVPVAALSFWTIDRDLSTSGNLPTPKRVRAAAVHRREPRHGREWRT